MDVFVYGTLTDPATAAEVLGEDPQFVADATLHGLHRVDGRYPTLAPGGRVEGRVLRTGRVAALDRYEGCVDGLYVRVAVPGDPPAEAYVGDPERLGCDVDWPAADGERDGDGAGGATGDPDGPADDPFAARVRAYVDGHDVRIERS